MPNDPDVPPVTVPGFGRLLIEALVFGGAIRVLYNAGAFRAGWWLALLVGMHYLLSYDRILWLLKQ